MANLIHQGFMYALSQGLIQSGMDLRVKLVMSSTTCDTEEDAINLDDFTEIDEFNGLGYEEIDCANVTWAYDATDNEYQLDFDDDEFNAAAGTVTPGSDDAVGMLFYLYVDGTLANDIALAFVDDGGFPFAGANAAIAYTPHADGAFFLKQQ